MNIQKLQQALERAKAALEGLEQAIDAGDNQKIGARLYELHQALQEAEHETR